MIKAKVLDSKPTFKVLKESSKKDITIKDIKLAMQELNLNYKRVDEIDIYNILSFIKSQKGK